MMYANNRSQRWKVMRVIIQKVRMLRGGYAESVRARTGVVCVCVWGGGGVLRVGFPIENLEKLSHTLVQGRGEGVVTRKRYRGWGSKCGEFGRNTFWMVPSGNYNDIAFMNFACLFNSGYNLLQFAQVNLYTTFGNISLVLVMQYKLRIKRVRVRACACMYVCMWT